MKELILNGTHIVLPAEFKNTFVEENPVLTKNGEYTLDINISLNNAVNAVFFAHINRFNIEKNKTISSAILIVDNKVKLNGTAEIMQVDNNTVTVQLLSGNSELNYLCDENLMMSAIDFGTAGGPVTLEIAVDANSKKWPETNFCCARNNIGEVLYNRIYKFYNTQTHVSTWMEDGVVNYNIQPFLMYYFKKVIEYLGYTITLNILDDDEFFDRLIIFSNVVSLDYNDLFPDWTVKKFLEQIETLGNIIYVIDKTDKTIRIMRSASFYNTAGTCSVPDKDIKDDYLTEVDDNDYGKLNYKKIKYNLDDSEFSKYQCISDEVLKIASIETYSNFAALLAAYPNDSARQLAFGTLKMFHVYNTSNYYIIKDYGNGTYYFKLINIFKEWNTGTEKDTFLELDIIPVEIIGAYIAYIDSVSQNEDPVTDINTSILNGVTEPDKATILRVGFQLGFTVIGGAINPDANAGYNIATTDCYKLLANGASEALISDINFWLSLRFNTAFGLYARYYSEALTIDSSRKWTIYFRWRNNYDVRNYFIFKNKKFYCEKIETDGDSDNNGGFVTGSFFPCNNTF